MFTGIIEEIGRVKSIKRYSTSVTLEIEAQKVLEDTKLGDSISTNGVCLTVTKISGALFTADVMPETISRTAFAHLKSGDRVNLERALCLNTRLGGHLVSGHIDGTGMLVAKRQDEIAIWLTFSCSTDILKYMIEKGSICIDGVSLTIVKVNEDNFTVSVIPHTQDLTTLCSKSIGSLVNLENDVIAKYVERLLGTKFQTNGLSLDFLQQNGF